MLPRDPGSHTIRDVIRHCRWDALPRDPGSHVHRDGKRQTSPGPGRGFAGPKRKSRRDVQRRIVHRSPSLPRYAPWHVQGTCSRALAGHKGTKPASVLNFGIWANAYSNFRWPRRLADARSTWKTSIAPFAYTPNLSSLLPLLPSVQNLLTFCTILCVL